MQLRLHDLKEALIILDDLNDKDYQYKDYIRYSLIRKDLFKIFEFQNPISNQYSIYYIDIDNKNKLYGLFSKSVSLSVWRNEKINKIKDAIIL